MTIFPLALWIPLGSALDFSKWILNGFGYVLLNTLVLLLLVEVLLFNISIIILLLLLGIDDEILEVLREVVAIDGINDGYIHDVAERLVLANLSLPYTYSLIFYSSTNLLYSTLTNEFSSYAYFLTSSAEYPNLLTMHYTIFSSYITSYCYYYYYYFHGVVVLVYLLALVVLYIYYCDDADDGLESLFSQFIYIMLFIMLKLLLIILNASPSFYYYYYYYYYYYWLLQLLPK